MKSNELRLGNIVKSGERYLIVSPHEIIAMYQCEIANVKSDYEPVLLTPEILEKCGFVVDGPNHVRIPKINGFDIYFYLGDKDVYLLQLSNTKNEFYMGVDIEIKYLHHLQNVIHALTQTELTIQL